jgi:hypothetical protein
MKGTYSTGTYSLKERVMNRMLMASLAVMTAVALLVGLALVPGGTSDVSAANAPEGCEKIQGTIFCGPVVENVGNAPEHSNSQETETTSTKKGSVNSSHEEVEECEGPPGQCN